MLIGGDGKQGTSVEMRMEGSGRLLSNCRGRDSAALCF